MCERYDENSSVHEPTITKFNSEQTLLQWQQRPQAVPAEWFGQGVQSLQALHAH